MLNEILNYNFEIRGLKMENANKFILGIFKYLLMLSNIKYEEEFNVRVNFKPHYNFILKY